MLPSVPWQLFDVVRSIILHIRSVKVSVYAISFILYSMVGRSLSDLSDPWPWFWMFLFIQIETSSTLAGLIYQIETCQPYYK